MSPGHSGQVWGNNRTLVLGVQVHLGPAHRDSGEHCDLRQPEPTSDLRCWKVTNNLKQAWLPSITGTSWHTQTHSAENALLSGWKGHFGIFFYIIKQTCTRVRRLNGLHSASDRLRLLSWGSWTLSGKDLLLQRKINPIFKLQTQPLNKASGTPSVILSSWSTLRSNGTEKMRGTHQNISRFVFPTIQQSPSHQRFTWDVFIFFFFFFFIFARQQTAQAEDRCELHFAKHKSKNRSK